MGPGLMAGAQGKGCEQAQSVVGTLCWGHCLPPSPSCSLAPASRGVQSVHFLLIFSLMQTLKPPQGREPPKAVSISPLFFPPQDCPKGPVGDNLAVVQALGPEGLHIGGWNLRAAFPKCVRGTRPAEATRCFVSNGFSGPSS